MRTILAIAICLALGASAWAQFNGCAPGFCSVGVASGGGGATGKILLVDGVSFVLQTDAASKLCLAGGC
jgi:hypothetical protein